MSFSFVVFVSFVLYLDKSAFIDSSLSTVYPSESAISNTFDSFAFIITLKRIVWIQFIKHNLSHSNFGGGGIYIPFPTLLRNMEATNTVDERNIGGCCRIVSGSWSSLESAVIAEAQKITHHYKERIQLLILCPSRERVFSLFSKICYMLRDTQLVCHASVGSLKMERDLRAFHFGVDILLVTPGRFARIYYGNENCFNEIQSLLLVEAEVLFMRSMITNVLVAIFYDE